MPTGLPRPPVKPKRTLFGVVLNTFMVLSALILTFIVLDREQRYALGQAGPFAGAFTQMTQQVPVDTTGESQVIPPSN